MKSSLSAESNDKLKKKKKKKKKTMSFSFCVERVRRKYVRV